MKRVLVPTLLTFMIAPTFCLGGCNHKHKNHYQEVELRLDGYKYRSDPLDLLKDHYYKFVIKDFGNPAKLTFSFAQAAQQVTVDAKVNKLLINDTTVSYETSASYYWELYFEVKPIFGLCTIELYLKFNDTSLNTYALLTPRT